MQEHPDEVWTPALIASAIGYDKRDSIRNTPLVLASRGKINKVGLGQYQARKRLAPAEPSAPNAGG